MFFISNQSITQEHKYQKTGFGALPEMHDHAYVAMKEKKMLRISVLALVLIAPFSAFADSTDDAVQSRAYVMCLAGRRVDPASISKDDQTECLTAAGVPDPGEAARKESSANWQDCLINQAIKWDDAVSPATDIARAIIGFCSNEYRARVNSLWLSPDAKKMLANDVQKYAIGPGMQAVLFNRKIHREAEQSRSK